MGQRSRLPANDLRRRLQDGAARLGGSAAERLRGELTDGLDDELAPVALDGGEAKDGGDEIQRAMRCADQPGCVEAQTQEWAMAAGPSDLGGGEPAGGRPT